MVSGIRCSLRALHLTNIAHQVTCARWAFQGSSFDRAANASTLMRTLTRTWEDLHTVMRGKAVRTDEGRWVRRFTIRYWLAATFG